MALLRRSSDNYIRLNKNITDKRICRIISEIADRELMTAQELCYEWIRARALQEIAFKEKVSSQSKK